MVQLAVLDFEFKHLRRFIAFLSLFKKKVTKKHPVLIFVETPENFLLNFQFSKSTSTIILCHSWKAGQLSNKKVFEKIFKKKSKPSLFIVFSLSNKSPRIQEITNEGLAKKIPTVSFHSRSTYSLSETKQNDNYVMRAIILYVIQLFQL